MTKQYTSKPWSYQNFWQKGNNLHQSTSSPTERGRGKRFGRTPLMVMIIMVMAMMMLPMAATPSDSACLVSSKASLKLQPDTWWGGRWWCGRWRWWPWWCWSGDQETCAMIVGQCSFCSTQASSSSFLSARDSDWNKGIDVESESGNRNRVTDDNKYLQTHQHILKIFSHIINIQNLSPEHLLQLSHWQTQPSHHLLRGAFKEDFNDLINIWVWLSQIYLA